MLKKLLVCSAVIVSGLMSFGAVARIGETEFDSVAEALASIQGEAATTITMLATDSSAVEIPSYVTINMTQNARLTGVLTGLGEVTLSAASTGSTYNQWFADGQLADFNGTVHLLQGRYEAQHNFSHAGLTVKIDDGAQLSTGGSGEWTCAFVVAGTGWTAESQYAISKAALRIGNSVTGPISAQEGSVVSVGTYNSNGITISGKITAPNGLALICNQGDASITVSGASNEISSATVTGAGTVVLGHQRAIGTTITVKGGATLNLNNQRFAAAGNGYALTCESGAKLRTSNNNYNSMTAVIKSLTLSGDLTIDKPSNMNNMSLGLGVNQNGADKTTLELGSHTLKLNNGDSFYFRGTTVTGDGTIEVAANQRVIIYQCATTAADATLKIAGNANVELQGNDGALTVKNLILNGNLAMNGSGDRPITVTGTLSGTGSIVNLALADGATIDVSEVPENGVVAQATNALTLGDNVKLAINGEVTEAYELTKEGNTVVATLKTEPEPEYDPDNDAAIGETKYASLDDAVKALQSGETVRLLRDVTLERSLWVNGGKTGTIDLNGYSITVESDEDGCIIEFAQGSTMTLTGRGTVEKETLDYAIKSAGWTTISGINGTPKLGNVIAVPSARSKVSFAEDYNPSWKIRVCLDWTGCKSNATTPGLGYYHGSSYNEFIEEYYDPIQKINDKFYEGEFHAGYFGNERNVTFNYLYSVSEVTMAVTNATVAGLSGLVTDPDTEKMYGRISKVQFVGSYIQEDPLPADYDVNFIVNPDSGYHNPKVMVNGVELEANQNGWYHLIPAVSSTAIVVTAEEIPTVPSWVDSGDSAAVEKYNSWATAKGVTDPSAAIKAAFALNCENTEEAALAAAEEFKLTIEIAAGGTIIVTTPKGYNVDPILKGKTELTEKTWTPITDDNKSSMKFFKAFIEL